MRDLTLFLLSSMNHVSKVLKPLRGEPKITANLKYLLKNPIFYDVFLLYTQLKDFCVLYWLF